MPSPLRIFLSSPGDVIPERRRANLVIEKLAKNYARFISITAVLWEVEPMLASGHFQDQIIPPSQTDILVLIVWSRLGTALPAKTETREYHGIDGRVPVTGTEWEFEDALAAQKQRGAPDLLAYRKQADPIVSLKDKAAVAEAEQQWEKLDVFWNRWFVNRGEFRAAFYEFANLDAFEAKLESDLRTLIERRIQASQATDHEPAAIWLTGSPFRGLESYRFEHAAVFFGRNAVTKSSVEQLTTNAENGRAFLLILAASGAGKSSLAQAGVLPSLIGHGIVPGVGQWRYAVMHPGGHPQGPLAALAEALVSQSALPEILAPNQTVAALAKHLRVASDDPCFPIIAALNGIESTSRARGELLEIESTRLAVIADQLEELFTSSEITPAERVEFIRCLNGMARSGRVFVIATMRSDYWHRASETPMLVEMAAGNGRIDLLPPAKDEIIEMIRQPAEAAGLDFENDPARAVRLDATLAAEAEANPGALPLLSFLLDELYKKDVKEGGHTTLTFASMQQLGGLDGAIANRAEATFTALPAEVQAALPKVLRTLVTVSRSGADATARVAPMSRFSENGPEQLLIKALLDPQVRLLVAEGDGAGARVRLAHEALITHWQRAKRQIAQDRDDLRTRAVAEEAALDWRNAAPHNKSGYLLRDPQLANAIDLASRWSGELDKDTLAFIEASSRRARRLHQFTIAAAAVFAIVAVLAGIAMYFADRELRVADLAKTRAETEEARALLNQSRLLVTLSDILLGQGYSAKATALSLEALPDLKHGNQRPYLLDAEHSLFASLQEQHERATLRGHTWTITNVAFSPDGRTLLTSSWDHHVKLWDTATWTQRLDLYDNAGAITTATFSPDGRYVLAAPNDGTARIFDAGSGVVLHRLAGTGDELSDASYSPDGSRIFTAANDKTPRLWDANTGRSVAVLTGHSDKVAFGAFSPDGATLITVGAEHAIRAWRASDGHFLFEISGLPDVVTWIAFSPNGGLLASGGADGSIQLWRSADGAPVRALTGPKSRVNSLVFSPNGEEIAAAYNDNVVRVWQIASGQEIVQLKGHTESVWWVTYSPDGQLIATTSPDKTVRVWNAETGDAVAVFRGHGSTVRRATFSSDGRWLASISGQGIDIFDRNADNTARIWDIRPSFEIATISQPRHVLKAAAVSPNNGLFVIRDADGLRDQASLSAPAQLWNADTHENLRDLRVGGDSINQAIASPDGSRILTIGRSGAAHLWDAATAANVAHYPASEADSYYMAAFSPDGSKVALAVSPRYLSSDKQRIVVLRSSDGGQIAVLSGPQTRLASLSFSRDGTRVLAAVSGFGSDRGFRIWPVKDGADATTIVKDDGLVSATFADGDATVLTIDDDSRLQSWQSDGGRQIGSWNAPTDFGSTTYLAPDGRAFVRTSPAPDSGIAVRIVDIHSGRELAVAIPDSEAVDQVAFAPDGSRFATYSEAGRVRVWETANAALVDDLTTTSAAPRILQFSTSGRLLAIGAGDGTIEFREIGANRQPQRLTGHGGAITCLAFAPDDRLILSGSADTTARVWDVATGQQTAVMQSQGTSLASVAFIPSGHRMLTVGSQQPVSTPQQATIVNAENGQTTATIALSGDASSSPPSIDNLEFSQAGDRILVNGSFVFDAHSGKLLMAPPADSSAFGLFIQGSALSASGRLVAWQSTSMGESNNTRAQIQIADVARGSVIRTITVTSQAADTVNRSESGAIAFSSDEKFVTFDDRIWSVETGEEWREPTGGGNPVLTFSADSKLLAVVSNAGATADPLQDAAAISDPRTGRTLFVLHSNSGPVTAVVIDPSGKLVATASDGTVELWDANSGRQTGLIDLKLGGSETFLTRGISRMAFAPDGRRLAISEGNKLHIWDLSAGTELYSTMIAATDSPFSSGVDRIAYSSDGRLIALSNAGLDGQGLHLWEAAGLKPIPLPNWPTRVGGSPFAFSPDGRRLISTPGDTQAVVIDTSNGAILATLRGHTFQVTAVAYSPDGRLIATGASDDKLHLWDADTLAEAVIATGHRNGIADMAFSPDGGMIAVAGADTTISLWDVKDRKLIRKFTGHEGAVTRLTFIDGGSTLVSVGADRTILIWNVGSGEQTAKIVHRGKITDAAVADKFIVSANDEPGTGEQLFQLALWDTATRRQLDLRYEQRGNFGVLISPDRRYLLIAPGNDDLQLYDLTVQKLVSKLSVSDSSLVGSSAVFSPDGDTLLTYSTFDGVHIWQTSTGKSLGVAGELPRDMLESLNGPKVDWVEFVSSGHRFLTHSTNQVVRLWDLGSRQLLATIDDKGAVQYQVTLDGRRLIATRKNGSVRIYQLPGTTQQLVDLACRLFPGPLTTAERQSYALDPAPEHYPCDRRPQP
jgi:WD40 repeat protein